MRRAFLILLPFLAAITVVIGGFYLYVGIRAVAAGNTIAGLIFGGFGAGGVILAMALWSFRRTLLGQRSTPPDAPPPSNDR